MRILDEYTDLINASFSQWIEVEDNLSRWTIEDFPYSTGVDENITYPHCWKCVTVNHCWFKNEENKKPNRFDYSNTSFSQTPLSKRGLYHPHCHCKELAINNPKIDDIELIIPENKELYTINKKSSWINAMGYDNYNNFFEILHMKTKENFSKCNYLIREHFQYGVQININVDMPGANEKINNIYPLKTAYTIFPNGKLKLNTHLGGYQDERI